ncbi:MAG: DUF6044 family protein [Bacteroidota bacterium]
MWWAILTLLALQFLPYLLLQGEAYIRIHDTLEGEGFWYLLLKESGLIFDYSREAVIPQVMNGLPRSVLPTGWSFLMLWVGVFGLYTGYIINYFLVHLIGFIGMYWLLRRYWIPSDQHQFIALGIALSFSWLPIFTTFGLSVMGQPLLIYALLNIAGRQSRWTDFLIVFLFPFYSSIVWAALPLLAIAAMIYGYCWWRDGQHNLHLLTALSGLTLMYILCNLHWFELLLFPGDFVSHRMEYSYLYSKPLELIDSFKHSFFLLSIGHYHIATMISLPVIAATIWMGVQSGWTLREKWLIGGIFLLALFYGFYNWISYGLGDIIPLIETFKFERLRILMPFLLLLLLASLLARMLHCQRRQTIVFFLVVQFLFIAAANDEVQHNIRQLLGQAKKPNYNAFFAPTLFENIAEFIDRPQSSYRVVHLGIHPSVAQYNGFYTLDSHHSIYDLRYKKQFGKALEKELRKDPVLYKEFNQWGNRCYLYSAELGKEGMDFIIGKNDGRSISDFQLETAPLKALGAEYLFAALAIENAASQGLQLLKTFEEEKSYWKVYVYQII